MDLTNYFTKIAKHLAFAKAAPLLAILLACILPVNLHAQSESSSLAPVEDKAGTNGPKNFEEYIKKHLSFYEPVYFVLGKPTTEFQYSIKYKIADTTGKYDPLTYLYFG